MTNILFNSQPTVDACAAERAIIAAAPDMYEALKMAIEEIKHLRNLANNDGAMIDCEEFTEGLAALAKAEGRQP